MEILSDLGFVAIPSIVVICYMFAEGVKVTDVDNKWIPLICMILGGMLGFVEVFINPSTISHDLLTAIAIGIVSGLSATGINQVFAQLSNK